MEIQQFCFRFLFLMHILLLMHFTITTTNTVFAASTLKLYIHEKKLSARNDTDYINGLMRHAKAAEMSSYMKPEIEACDNFFEFACGNWAKINPANGLEPRETNFYKLLLHSFQHKQLRVLESPIDTDADSDAEVKVKNFYRSCKRVSETAEQTKRYKYKLREIIHEFGHMPALLPEGAWLGSDFDWLKTIASIQQKYGIDIILQIGVRPDFENVTTNKVFIGEPSLHLRTKSMYTGEATQWHRDQYQLEIQQRLQDHLGLTEQRAISTAKEILDFEVELARGLFNHKTVKTLRSLAKLRTNDELASVYAPSMNLQKFLNIAFNQANFNDSAYEYMLEYQENLKQLMPKANKTHVANYIYYQLVQNFFYDSGVTAAEQEKFCLQKTQQFFVKLLDNIVYRKFIYDAKNEAEVEVLWQTLKDTFKAVLESEKTNWMSLMTRKLAIEKLDAMRLEINSQANKNFSEQYKALQLTDDDYVENMKHLFEERAKRTIASLYELPKPAEEPVKSSFTPAYVGTENLIKIPVLILQPNFLWSTYYPKALKFGNLGYLVAHELLHGFDDLGCNYDLNGQERHWWDENTRRAFNERKQCFKQQYSHYLYGGKYLPESDLQSENIADNGAVQLAYTAYTTWLASSASMDENKKIEQTETLPHLNYTSKQLFFISFAQFWCNDVNERLKDKVSLIDVHAPAMYRVIGSLANFNEFAKVFWCASGTRMNPEKKCQIY